MLLYHFNEQATGTAILEELQRQRQTIDRSRERNVTVNTNIDQAESTLQKMKRWWRLF